MTECPFRRPSNLGQQEILAHVRRVFDGFSMPMVVARGGTPVIQNGAPQEGLQHSFKYEAVRREVVAANSAFWREIREEQSYTVDGLDLSAPSLAKYLNSLLRSSEYVLNLHAVKAAVYAKLALFLIHHPELAPGFVTGMYSATTDGIDLACKEGEFLISAVENVNRGDIIGENLLKKVLLFNRELIFKEGVPNQLRYRALKGTYEPALIQFFDSLTSTDAHSGFLLQKFKTEFGDEYCNAVSKFNGFIIDIYIFDQQCMSRFSQEHWSSSGDYAVKCSGVGAAYTILEECAVAAKELLDDNLNLMAQQIVTKESPINATGRNGRYYAYGTVREAALALYEPIKDIVLNNPQASIEELQLMIARYFVSLKGNATQFTPGMNLGIDELLRGYP